MENIEVRETLEQETITESLDKDKNLATKRTSKPRKKIDKLSYLREEKEKSEQRIKDIEARIAVEEQKLLERQQKELLNICKTHELSLGDVISFIEKIVGSNYTLNDIQELIGVDDKEDSENA